MSRNLFAASTPAQRKTCEIEVSDSHGRRYTKFRIDRESRRIIVEMEVTE